MSLHRLVLPVLLVGCGGAFWSVSAFAENAPAKRAASVAQFGMLLRDSSHKGNATMASVLEMAQSSRGADKQGYRTEFLELVNAAARLLPTKEIARTE